jgi:hypothetical protein
MDEHRHNLGQLFAQLGLPNSPGEIDRFLVAHRPLASDVALQDAGFWSEAQKEFLREGLCEDADWAPVVDGLDALLRQ